MMRSTIQKLWQAFFYSLAGLRAAWHDEQAFRIEVVVAIIATPVAFTITDQALERALLLATLLLVMLVELINSAIEAAIDRISDEQHPLSKKAKDCGSAAVLVAAIIAGLVWFGVLFG